MNFNKWLNTFLSEKEIDLDETITIEKDKEFHILTVGVVVEAMINTNKEEQKKIKQVLIQIDMKNGDVLDFIKFCAKVLVNNH